MQWLDEMGERGLEILRDPEKGFGEGLRARRQVLGWSQRQLSEALEEQAGVKLDPSAVTRIEAGRSITLRQAVALTYVVGAESIDEMLDEATSRPIGSWREFLEERRAETERLAGEAEEVRRQLATIEAVLRARQGEVERLEVLAEEEEEAERERVADRG